MAKKRKNFLENMDEGPVVSPKKAGADDTEMNVDQIMLTLNNDPMMSMLMQSMPPENARVLQLIIELMIRGVMPKDYEMFFNMFQCVFDLDAEEDASFDEKDDSGQMSMFGIARGSWKRKSAKAKKNAPLKNASELTLLLKIQMKGVAKPPMWREVEVPASWNFLDLHDTIQTLMGFHDSHLWQFNRTAYDESLVIGVKKGDAFSPGLGEVTDEADATPLTSYLNSPGDSLEYVYDFGDDWIFTVELKKVLEKKSGHAVCTKLKSELQPMENSGGPWAYVEMREAMAKWRTLTKQQREEVAEEAGYDSPDDYYETISGHVVTVDDLNEMLR